MKCKCGHTLQLKVEPDVYGYALFELFENFTKKWRTNLCDQCEKNIFKHNRAIRKIGKVYKEVG